MPSRAVSFQSLVGHVDGPGAGGVREVLRSGSALDPSSTPTEAPTVVETTIVP